MNTPQQELYDFCTRRIQNAAKHALQKDLSTARTQLFDALDALKVLCNAEKNPDARAFYEAKAGDLLELVILLRTEGLSPSAVDRCTELAGADYMSPSAPQAPNAQVNSQKDVPPQFTGGAYPSADNPSRGFGADVTKTPPKKEEEPKDIFISDIPFDDKNSGIYAPADGSLPSSDVPNGQKFYDASGTAMRPQKLSDFLGQPQAVVALRDPIDKARLSGTALQHVLLFGSHGLGKTTLAKIIANEMGAGFVEINNAGTITAEAAIHILSGLKEGDVLFIDEVHNIPEQVASGVFYPAMEDFCVNYVSGKGKFTKTVTLKLPRFTVIGATTEAGKLAPPFKDRFLIHCHLSPYPEEVLANIALNSFRKLGVSASYEVALEIAVRSRSTPRIVNSYVSRIADKAIVLAASQKGITGKGSLSSVDKIRSLGVQVTKDLVLQYFKENGIDRLGLRNGDRELLKVLIQKFNGGPAGQENLAKALNESVNVVSAEYESYLIKIGFINVLSRGRIAMPAAYRYLGLKVPDHILSYVSADDDNDGDNKPSAAGGQADNPAPVEDNPVPPEEADLTPPEEIDLTPPAEEEPEYNITVEDGNPERREKIDGLINMSGAEVVPDETLDARFPDLERSYESAAKNISSVNWSCGSQKRNLYCDSKLERRFIAYLSSCGYIKDIKTQCLALEYQNDSGSSKLYYPDFFLLTYDGKVAIVEMKNISSMSYHLNMAKYEALKTYALENGYGYAEIGKDEKNNCYVSAEELASRPVNQSLKEHILSVISEREGEEGGGYFGKDDFAVYLSANPGCDPLDVHILLLQSGELKNVDRSGENLKIVKRETNDR